jgi:hypothetical protein
MSLTWYDIFCDRCIAKLEKKRGMSIDDAYDIGKLSFTDDGLCDRCNANRAVKGVRG